MKKFVILLLTISLTCTNLFAINSDDVVSAGFNSLTDQQKAEVIKSVADQKLKTESTSTQAETVDTAQKWVNLGASIGKGLASSAKELGIAVNDFAKTSVGQWTMFLIIFSVIGNDIIHIGVGLIVLITGLTFTTLMLNRKHRWVREYDENTGKLIKNYRNDLSGDTVGTFWLAYMVVIIVSLTIMITGG